MEQVQRVGCEAVESAARGVGRFHHRRRIFLAGHQQPQRNDDHDDADHAGYPPRLARDETEPIFEFYSLGIHLITPER